MQMSDTGLALLTALEGKMNRVYLDSAGFATIGVGHLLTKSERSSHAVEILGEMVPYENGLTDEQITALLRQDVHSAEAAIVGYVSTPLSQNRFDALVCLVFNIGNVAFFHSSLLKAINAGDWGAVPDFWRMWRRAGGKVVQGLIVRRERELKLWEQTT